MKFLRVIRFDASDEHVFAQTAVADEWAISGAFAFADMDEDDIKGKTRQAFANGFLGLPSFGRSTFATIAEIGDGEMEGIDNLLADHFEAEWGAPGRREAMAAAKEETGFIADLCAEQPVNTVFTLRRSFDRGEIREEFRNINPPSAPAHASIWEVVEDDG